MLVDGNEGKTNKDGGHRAKMGNCGVGESTKLPVIVFEERKEAAITLPAAPDKLKEVEVTFKLHLHC